MQRHSIGFRPKGRIGLLGGSFDPAHLGHVHISQEAMRRFALREVWWLMSPQNPLKQRMATSLTDRMAQSAALLRDPRVKVLDYETQIGSRFTHDTLSQVTQDFPDVDFVWLMGADNLAQFHRWQRWQDIMHIMPLGILARPHHRMSGLRSKAARVYHSARIAQGDSHRLSHYAAPAWCFVNIPMSPLSSTQVRLGQRGV